MVCPLFIYEFAFAVLTEEIGIRLILSESLLNLAKTLSFIIETASTNTPFLRQGSQLRFQ